VDGAAEVANANIAWLLIRVPENKQFLLSAHRGLPDTWSGKMNKPLDDGVTSLVALSGETLTMDGDPLLRFRISNLGKSVCVVPIKVQLEVIGMLVVVRKEANAFTKTEQTLLEAVADYASISLVNARLFRALNDSAQSAKEVQKRQNAVFENIRNSITEELRGALQPVDLLLTEMPGALTKDQKQALQTVRAALGKLSTVAEKTSPSVHMTQKNK
jgi:GAF domain-containing protein